MKIGPEAWKCANCPETFSSAKDAMLHTALKRHLMMQTADPNGDGT